VSNRLLQDITCPCGEQFESELWSSVNVKEAPELRDEILAGQLNVVNCSICKRFVYAERFVLYHDPAAELMAFVYPADAGSEAQKWREKTREDFAAAQEVIPDRDRLPYSPLTLFGMDELVAILVKEQEMQDQAEVLKTLAASLGVEVRSLRKSAARSAGIPSVLPLTAASERDALDRLGQGVERLVIANDRLTVYAALKEKLARRELDASVLSGLQ
jgi:hypothetical protein